MEDLPLGRIAALVPEFAVKDLPLGRTLMMMMNVSRSSYISGHQLIFPFIFILPAFMYSTSNPFTNVVVLIGLYQTRS